MLEGSCKKTLWGGDMLPELGRIYRKKTEFKLAGHPVHYMLCSDDYDTSAEMTSVLLRALLQNGRISSRRYCTLNVSAMTPRDARFLFTLYQCASGGAVVLRYSQNTADDNDEADMSTELVDMLRECIKRSKNEVLTILCFPAACEAEKKALTDGLTDMTFVELREDFVSRKAAIKYLETRAAGDGLKADSRLFDTVKDEQEYYPFELNHMYNNWYSGEMRNKAYPQYSGFESMRKKMLSDTGRGNAYEKLMGMAGLDEAKSVIQKTLNYYKVQQLYKEKNIKTESPSMHMVFTGNPGTAKTTVARLFAEIMRDNRMLSKGHLVEVGRGDLVGKYVGWTAQTVHKKFREARGGVLFIDEAYSLLDDRSGSFGDEAINTIVQEMENNRKDLAVILAGYPDKMEEFLARNPGLRSRISFHVPFADYSPEELTEITEYMAAEKGFSISPAAAEKLINIYSAAVKTPDFGNGRYARNILEQALLEQASRLLHGDPDMLSAKQLCTLLPEDFVSQTRSESNVRRIGFCSY